MLNKLGLEFFLGRDGGNSAFSALSFFFHCLIWNMGIPSKAIAFEYTIHKYKSTFLVRRCLDIAVVFLCGFSSTIECALICSKEQRRGISTQGIYAAFKGITNLESEMTVLILSHQPRSRYKLAPLISR